MQFFSQERWLYRLQQIKAYPKELILAFILVITSFVFPTIANAGFFSFVTDFSANKASAETRPATTTNNPPEKVTSQNMVILSAAINPNPNPDTISSSDLPILGNAIAPEAATLDSATNTIGFVNTAISTYVVRQGDTPALIAKLFGVSVNTLIWANDLSANPILTPGQTIVILPVSGINYTFKKGDTLQAVVKKFNADLTEVLQYNNVTATSTLAIGDSIIIPDAELGTIKAPSANVQKTTTIARYTGKGIPPRSLWGVTGENPAHDTNGPDLGDYFIRPVAHGVVTQGLHGFNAVDIAAPVGTPLLASAAGTVIVSKTSGWNGGYGNYIVISHPNGTQTVYGHASKNYVSVGQTVSQGQVIGLVGKTGEATGAHAHFEIRGAKNDFATPVAF